MTLPTPHLQHVGDLTVFVSKPIDAGQVIVLNSFVGTGARFPDRVEISLFRVA